MVRHIILWKIKEEKSNSEKAEIKMGVKNGLESLAGKIPGLLEIKVETNGLASSSADLMLDSAFENEESLKEYATHPEHMKVADIFVKPFMEVRMCLDFESTC
ncbi:MAG: Dabb family protein [Clostridiales bacterium]|nr:Dabb family protein [Clostridiales bacterium]